MGFDAGPPREAEACALFNADVSGEVRSYPRLRTVVLAARWTAYTSDADTAREVAQSLERTLGSLERAGKHVVVIAPGVDFPAPVPACIARRGESACSLARVDAEARRQRALRTVQDVVSRHRGVVLLDPMATLCDQAT